MRILRMAGFLILIALVILASGPIEESNAQRNRPAPGFLQSTAIRLQLGVWDKFDVDSSDRAVFLVTSAGGKQYRAERRQSLDDWVYVNFPDDFAPYPSNTHIYTSYTWKCIVDGKTVANGKFMWGNSKAADTSVY